MEYVWDTYPYYNYGVSDANRHIDTLPANNIGCFEQSTKDGVILSYVYGVFAGLISSINNSCMQFALRL